MSVPSWVWVSTIAVAVVVLLLDVVVVGRRPHEPSMRECSLWLAGYLVAAVSFGAVVWTSSGTGYGTEFFAGWLTEYSLSIDNLFVFLIIMARLDVPRPLQQSALLIGIVLALLLRGAFIAVGAAAIATFAWTFYLFGAFLIYTAVKLARDYRRHAAPGPASGSEGRLVRWLRWRLPVTDGFVGTRLVVRRGGRRLMTPMLLVVAALASTDLLFALDSIPAIYGLTEEPYLVLTANLFALMGLRQLYFLLGGLLQRLVYLSLGLSVLLGFIGVKLVLHALHENSVPWLNGGRPVDSVPQLPTWLSLVVIVAVLGLTTITSLARSARVARSAR
ncbi:MAG TPA: TerC/Alx family metal homeostasis membrane protein [Jatrophihabitans sp.]|nr:TerC/Alx family metal homeostasis membrane protein [Jatrophihabitans sp.]